MLKNIIKNNFNQALGISILFVYYLNFSSKSSIDFFSQVFIVSFFSYLTMFLIGLYAFKKNKIIGLYLLTTVLFVPPSIFPEYSGLLFPITYLSHFSYIGYLISLNLFKKWKNNHEL